MTNFQWSDLSRHALIQIKNRHGRSRVWLKIKNPASPAMQRVCGRSDSETVVGPGSEISQPEINPADVVRTLPRQAHRSVSGHGLPSTRKASVS